FINHRMVARSSQGGEGMFPLEPQSVAEFYQSVIGLLKGIGVVVAISDKPSELPNPIRFSKDRVHAAYQPEAVNRFWRILVQADRVLKLFRTGFLGKVS